MTEPRRRVLDALCALQAENGGWPVPVRVLQARCGVASPSTTQHHLHQLEADGLIERSVYPKGGWRVVPPTTNGG